jgi:hypothetical protein
MHWGWDAERSSEGDNAAKPEAITSAFMRRSILGRARFKTRTYPSPKKPDQTCFFLEVSCFLIH